MVENPNDLVYSAELDKVDMAICLYSLKHYLTDIKNIEYPNLGMDPLWLNRYVMRALGWEAKDNPEFSSDNLYVSQYLWRSHKSASWQKEEPFNFVHDFNDGEFYLPANCDLEIKRSGKFWQAKVIHPSGEHLLSPKFYSVGYCFCYLIFGSLYKGWIKSEAITLNRRNIPQEELWVTEGE